MTRLGNISDTKIRSSRPGKRRLNRKVTRTYINKEGNKVDSYVTSYCITKKPIIQHLAPKSEDIPTLAHNLDRVLFSPGIHFLQDPRTRIYNFSPFLKKVIDYKDFKFEELEEFKPVSKHPVLLKYSREFQKQFYSSTSSMTSMLTKFYFLLNDYNPRNVSRFGSIPFTGVAKKLPTSLIVSPQGDFIDESNKKKPIYSVQADSSCDSEILLSAMGMCLEVLLTSPQDEFVKYDRTIDSKEKPEELTNTYNYAGYGDFLMRSQLDCYDERLPGNGTFDLKTRASSNIRYSSSDASKAKNDYQIWKLTGDFESFEREFRDLVRTGALLKFLFQARIGQMDGIFIAYHNINSIFGFQYLPLEELDKLYYRDTAKKHITYENILEQDELPSLIGESQFKMSMEMWQTLLQEHIIKDLNEEFDNKPVPFRLVAENVTSFGRRQALKVYVLPATKEEINELQDIPKRYPSGYKHDLTDEERMINLDRQIKDLALFNAKMVSKNKLFVYNITMVSGLIDQKEKEYITLPSRKFDNWQVKYKITKVKNPKKDSFVEVFDLPLQTFAQQLSMNHEIYEQIGARRKRAWAARERKPIVYHPKYKF
ncbi:hypothetical protein SBY92_004369 [Candida maltosa Xu316]